MNNFRSLLIRLSALVGLLCAAVCHAQPLNFDWVNRIGGSGSEVIYGAKVDSSGNILVTGRTSSGSFTLGGSSLTTSGSADIFVAKLDSAGNWLWARTVGGNGFEEAYGIALDSQGDAYVVGSYASASLTFGTSTVTHQGGSGSDIFVAKIDSNGTWVWAAGAGGSGADSAAGVAVNGSGEVFVAGNFRSSVADFGTTTLNNGGGADAFVGKLDTSGVWVWAKSAAGNLDETFYGCAVDAGGNVYVAGHSSSALLTLGSDTLTGAGGSDFLVGKLDSTGVWIWARSAGGSGNDYINAAGIDANGDMRIAGYFQSATLNFGVTNLTIETRVIGCLYGHNSAWT
jgi:hypothetical protein